MRVRVITSQSEVTMNNELAGLPGATKVLNCGAVALTGGWYMFWAYVREPEDAPHDILE